jgi:hypothetical protein
MGEGLTVLTAPPNLLLLHLIVTCLQARLCCTTAACPSWVRSSGCPQHLTFVDTAAAAAPDRHVLAGQIVLHSSGMPKLGEKFRVPATDNDPCFPGYTEGVILEAPEEESCSFKDKTHFWQKVSYSNYKPLE